MASVNLKPPNFDDLSQWFDALMQPVTLIDISAILLSVAVAWLLTRSVRNALPAREPSILFGRKSWDGVLFPLLLLCLVSLAKVVLARWLPLVAGGVQKFAGSSCSGTHPFLGCLADDGAVVERFSAAVSE